MSRPLRLEFPGALYHVTARGNDRQAIYLDDADRLNLLEVLAEVVTQFNWRCHAYCLMDNHYHLLIETPDANLSRGMRQLNGVYTQNFNRSRGRSGHVFQGRYKAVLVDQNEYLLEVARYIVLNPVRARMVRDAKNYGWSSYSATAGLAEAQGGLFSDWLLSQFGKRKSSAQKKYAEFVSAGKGQPSPFENVKHQAYLGSDAFVNNMINKIASNLNPVNQHDLSEIPVAQRTPMAKSLEEYNAQEGDRNTAMLAAFNSGAYTQKAIADFYGVHYSRVSKILASMRNQ